MPKPITSLRMQILELIRSRRSIRKYSPQPVKDTEVDQIIEAGIWAPSSGGSQPYKFLILRERNQIDELYHLILEQEIKRYKLHLGTKKTEDEICDQLQSYYGRIQTAPVHILILFDVQVGADKFTEGDVDKFMANEYLYSSLRDSLFFTTQNMMLMATVFGLGSLYLETLRFHKKVISDFLGLRETLEFFVCIPIGYPDEEPEGKKRSIQDFLL